MGVLVEKQGSGCSKVPFLGQAGAAEMIPAGTVLKKSPAARAERRRYEAEAGKAVLTEEGGRVKKEG